jgi:hypothetical protein
MGHISQAIANIPDRLFTNLFDAKIVADVGIPNNSDAPALNTNYASISKRMFSVDFGGDFSIDYDYNETLKQHFIKKANLAKTVTMSFYEGKSMQCVKAFRADWNSIFDTKTNSFKLTNPNRTISIYIYGDANINGVSIKDGSTITLTHAKIQNFKYPKFSWKDKEPAEVSATFSFDKLDVT